MLSQAQVIMLYYFGANIVKSVFSKKNVGIFINLNVQMIF
ncbi:hypothetical protein FLCU109888_01050 [Flavobacterium cucumis]|uniref:Uncharacterized protein n=1 Tax=Flavobacterium cucumis TaxID=416016 RepID=A0A1M7ZTL8_9FLAO|nr:hypothetical protein SAMN05443547_0558 [Flavobacterium cucumis]